MKTKVSALRRISALGRITYEKLRFEGDGTIKSQVITRYLTAEAEAQKGVRGTARRVRKALTGKQAPPPKKGKK